MAENGTAGQQIGRDAIRARALFNSQVAYMSGYFKGYADALQHVREEEESDGSYTFSTGELVGWGIGLAAVDAAAGAAIYIASK